MLELERLLGQSGDTPPTVFPPNSRYLATPIAKMELDGVEVVYLRRRFVPDPGVFAISGHFTVSEGDRLDNLSAKWIGDPEMFWRLCDANRAMQPTELEVIGETLKVPLPQGIPATKGNG